MSIALKPKEEPNGNISQVFNLNNFYKSNDYASKSDLLSYANLYTSNFFQYLNTFTNGLNFAGAINGITDEIFSYIQYIPNIISDIRNINYDEINNSTNITGNTYFETSSINTNLNIGNQLSVNNILTQEMLSNTIHVNELNCRNLKLNNRMFNEIIGFVYLNSISLPIQKSNLISNFNITPINTMYFTIKNDYRIDIVDVNNRILFSFVNTSEDFIYYNQIPYNSNMIKINIYNSLNVIII
jgi:hypothetical protein